MNEKVLRAFNDISEELSKVYKQSFKDGEGRLLLTDEENLLETGIEIKACHMWKN